MEKKESNRKSTIASTASSTIGAAIGVVAGSAISSSQAQAADTAEANPDKTEQAVNVENHPTPAESAPTDTSSVSSSTPSPHQSSVQESGSEPPSPAPSLQPEQTASVEVEVLSYETITEEDGSQIDIAVVTSDGQPAIIADIDHDGHADVVASDLNNNGQLESSEVMELPGHTLAMQPLHDAAVPNQPDDNGYTIQTEDFANTGDYINDANVQEYMA